MAYIATFQGRAAPEHVDVVKESLRILESGSREQSGTIRYEFYQSEENPLVFMLFAIWESEADWKANVASEAHVSHAKSLPEGAWTIWPVKTDWLRLSNQQD